MAVTSTLSDLWISNAKSQKMSNLTPSCSLINSFLFMCSLTVRLFAFFDAVCLQSIMVALEFKCDYFCF